ncbi:hypothetical protein L1987_38103 [Smallanthus sonchifolius]|uniref:Uncharacterized protein n=1 Tax=Smallanthus sonchifolius TaxID=185202 RepID=A0ACB9HJ48_9ASTR|nr:hypothetical protein L1987_38103 [Smallanthus sonchifolius]
MDRRFVIMDNLVVMSTLIATASYAAGFTVPGGFNSSEGSLQATPFLLRKPAFQAFIVANSIAFSSSCCVLLGHIALLLYRNRYDEASRVEQEYIDERIEDMYYITTVALLAMIIAFVTGVYVVLTPSHGLAISVCVMSLLVIVLIIHKDALERCQQHAGLYLFLQDPSRSTSNLFSES